MQKIKYPMKPIGKAALAHRRIDSLRYQDRQAEDSLENTFSCVPKVQGESRISQAKGQRRMMLYFYAVLILWGLHFVFY